MARDSDGWCTTSWWSCGCCCQTIILPIICSFFFLVGLALDELGVVDYEVPESLRDAADRDEFRVRFGSIRFKTSWDADENSAQICGIEEATDDWKKMCHSGRAYLFFGLLTFFLYYVVAFWHMHLHKGIRQQITFQDCFDAMPYSSKIRIALSFTPMVSWFFWLCACWAAYNDALQNTYDTRYTTLAIGEKLIDPKDYYYFSMSSGDPDLHLGGSFWFILIPIFGFMLPLTCCCCCQPELYKDIVGRQTGDAMNDQGVAVQNPHSFNGSVPMAQPHDQLPSYNQSQITNEGYTTVETASSPAGSAIIVPQE